MIGKKTSSRQEKLANFKQYVKENTTGDYIITDKSTYVSSGKPTIVMKHKTCGNTYTVCTNAFKHGNRCPYCNGNKAKVKDIKWFTDKLRELTGDEYKLVEGQVYKNVKTKLLVEHTLCGNVEGYTPQDFISKHSRCHNCKLSGEKDRKFNKKLLKETNGEFCLDTDSHYISAKKSLKIIHRDCGETIERIPDNIFTRGVKCNCYSYSKGEHYIKQYLSKHQIKFEMSKKFDDLWDKSPKDLLRYDFYLPKYKVLIEYQGKQHYKPYGFSKVVTEEELIDRLAIQNLHDAMKRQYAKDNGYRLLEIPYKYKDYNMLSNLLDLVL